MKKPFYPRTNAAGLIRRFSLPTLIVGVVLVILIVIRFAFPGAFFFLATPFWKAGDALTQSVDQLWGGLASKQSLMKQVQTLQEERDALFQENQTLSGKLADIEKTVQGAEGEHLTVVAGVIARPPVSPYDTLTISLPVSYSPNTGTLVVGTGGAPLGTITDVAGGTAKVTLFSEKGRNTEGWIGESRIAVTLTGTGTSSFEATLPGTASVAEGDNVYVPGGGALFLGKVVRITKDDSTQKLHLSIRPSVNASMLSYVGILKP